MPITDGRMPSVTGRGSTIGSSGTSRVDVELLSGGVIRELGALTSFAVGTTGGVPAGDTDDRGVALVFAATRDLSCDG